MMNFSKLAVLGAALAVASPFASAIGFTGQITVQDSPASDVGSFDNTTFVLDSVYAGPETVGPSSTTQPNPTNGTPNLVLYAYNVALYTFATGPNTASPSPSIIVNNGTGVELFSGATAVSGGLTTAFYGLYTGPVNEDSNGDYGVTVYGYFVDGLGNRTAGYDNVSFNSGTLNTTADTASGATTEILTATPAPEPNSLMLLGTGLVSAAGMLVRRRRIV